MMIEAKEIQWTEAVLSRFWAYWSRRPQTYFAESMGPSLLRRFRHALAPGSLAVDYGCGSGGLVKVLLGAGYRVLAVDFSTETLNAVETRFGAHPGFAGASKADDLGGFAGTAQAVFLVEAAEHMDDQRLADCLGRVMRLLKPGGILVVTTPNQEDIEAAKVYCPCCDTVFHPMQHQRSWSGQTLSQCLSAAGFHVQWTLETDFGADSPRQVLPYTIRLFKKALRRIDRDPHLCVVAVKP